MPIGTIVRLWLAATFAVFQLFCVFDRVSAQFPAGCDRDKSCTLRALALTVNQGRGAHYVDVDRFSIQNNSTTALTAEMWIKLERRAGTVQYLGGQWGPGRDNNDVWVVYVDRNDDLVFELNGDGTKLGATDNTIVRVPGASVFGRWAHVAAVFDGSISTAFLFIDGILAGSANNAGYPTRYLRPVEDRRLGTQIGSCNAISDNPNNQTFRGQIDEVRIWNRALPQPEIRCQMNKALAGNENGLQVYYRFNENPGVFDLCDATGRGNTGRARSGASCANTDRPIPRTVVVSRPRVDTTVRCESQATFQFTVVDTAFCASEVALSITGPDAGAFRVSQGRATLNPNQPVTFTVNFNSSLVGTIVGELRVTPLNACGVEQVIPLNVNRVTQLSYSLRRVTYDTLYAGCRDRLFQDTIIRICNTSDSVGQRGPVSITGLVRSLPLRFELVSPVLPTEIQPGQCIDLRLRYNSTDTSTLSLDTLRFQTTDRCPGTVVIPLRGTTREVFLLTRQDGRTRYDSVAFPRECIGIPSNPSSYLWRNQTSRPVFIDTIIAPRDFLVRAPRFPFALQPNTGYPENIIRFQPSRSGPYRDSVIFRARIQGSPCVIEKKVYVSGSGYDTRIAFDERLGSAGNVWVGRDSIFNVPIENSSPDTLRVSVYLKVGEVFFLNGGRALTVLPGRVGTIPVTFRPLLDSLYQDTICLMEQRCFTRDCIPISGRGIIERFRFNPVLLRIDDVVACDSSEGTVWIVNQTSKSQEIRNIQLSDPAGKYRSVNPNPFPPVITLGPGDSVAFTFRYKPTDTVDRSDRAFLRYTNDDVPWAASIIATSATPKLFVTQQRDFGLVEVGDRRRGFLTIENTSKMAVSVDTVILPPGYRVIAISRTLPDTLAPRDSISVEIEFNPTQDIPYNARYSVISKWPCLRTETGLVRGEGHIIRLEAPRSLLSWGFVRPCECVTQTIPLVNQSLVFDMNVDSMWIDSIGVPNGTPWFWTWSSTYSPNGTTPFVVPKDSRDTVRVTFCPRTPAEDRFVDCAAQLRIRASGSSWTAAFNVFLIGKRALMHKPLPIAVNFPPTRVDTLSASRFTRVHIPPVALNPDRVPVRIDSISFEPDERVFFVGNPPTRDSLGRPNPWLVSPGDTLGLPINFRPRAPRLYRARLRLHTSQPCRDIDTTVLVTGTGFANAFALDFYIGRDTAQVDTFRIPSCDTLRLPIWSSREMPADLVDIRCRIGHDTSILRYVGVESHYLTTNCFPEFPPNATGSPDPNSGTQFLLKNFCNVDSVRPVMTAKFVPTSSNRAALRVTVDSLSFDTERTIRYLIVPGNDNAWVVIDKTEIRVESPINFDSVRVLDCKDTTIVVRNTGDMPVRVDSLPGLAPTLSFVSSQPPRDSMINPGETTSITVRYCPTRESVLDTVVRARTVDPCTFVDSNAVRGYGYAPDIPVAYGTSPVFTLPDTLRGTIGDTITVTLYQEKDLAATYRGVTYWLRDLSFDVGVFHNPSALKFLSATSAVTPQLDVAYSPGDLRLTFNSTDSLRGGPIAELRFRILIPDTSLTRVSVNAFGHRTDSLMFVDIVPTPTRSVCQIDGQCNLNTLVFSTSGGPQLIGASPNPVTESGVVIRFRVQEEAPVNLVLYSASGERIRSLLDGHRHFVPGQYDVRADVSDLGAGTYFYTIESGVFRQTGNFTLVR